MKLHHYWMVLGILLLAAVGWLLGEEEYYRIKDPTGNYVAVATYRRYKSFLAMRPGGSGDKSGFVAIRGGDGANYGKVPVQMVSAVRDVQWQSDGAKLPLYATWEFPGKTVRYWNDEQTQEIVRNVR